jgi:hypothetical protein
MSLTAVSYLSLCHSCPVVGHGPLLHGLMDGDPQEDEGGLSNILFPSCHCRSYFVDYCIDLLVIG